MGHLPLTRERLERLLSVLKRQGGTETVRQLARRFGIFEHEVLEAAALGWIRIAERKPAKGRPSRVAEILSDSLSAKLPPFRGQLGKAISYRHFRFALDSAMTMPYGSRIFGGPCLVDIYVRWFPNAKSRAGAAASCSRLMKHPDVLAVRAWMSAQVRREIPITEPVPPTAKLIWKRLRQTP